VVVAINVFSFDSPLELELITEIQITFQIENAKKFGVPVVVAINVFSFDSPAELELITEIQIIFSD
jgi:formyltetrahydrofolate synthetase